MSQFFFPPPPFPFHCYISESTWVFKTRVRQLKNRVVFAMHDGIRRGNGEAKEQVQAVFPHLEVLPMLHPERRGGGRLNP